MQGGTWAADPGSAHTAGPCDQHSIRHGAASRGDSPFGSWRPAAALRVPQKAASGTSQSPQKATPKTPQEDLRSPKTTPNASQRYLKRLGIQGSLQTAPGTLRVSEKAASGPPRAPKKQSQKSRRPLKEAQQSSKKDPKNQNSLTNIAHVQGEKETQQHSNPTPQTTLPGGMRD